MSTLNALQTIFQNYLLHGDQAIAQHIVGESPAFIDTRLQVYQYAYKARISDCLREDYPILAYTLGEEDFDQLVMDYLDIYPSHYYSVSMVGKDVPIYLKETVAYQNKRYLVDIAKYEWTMSQLIEAEDVPTMTMENLLAIPQESWPSMRLFLHPSVSLHSFSYDVAKFRQAYQENEAIDPSAYKIDKAVWTLWRKNYDNYYCKNTELECCALNAIRDNLTFAELCESLLNYLPEDDAPSFALNFLMQSINDGLFLKA